MLKIARGLEPDSVLNGSGNERWHTSNINRILTNEKHIGDALFQKTYNVDFLTKKTVKNNGSSRSTMWRTVMKPLSRVK